MFAEAYFDESESRNPGVYCVAGYVFTKERHEALRAIWVGILQEYGLSHFHMVDCAHGNKEFRRLSMAQRVEVQTRLFDALKVHIERGICVTFDMSLAPQVAKAVLHGVANVDPYTLCAYVALDRVAAWGRSLGESVEVKYYFEAGSAGQVKADHLLRDLFSSKLIANRMRYGGHAFISKRKAVGVQCADVLAWQAAKDRKSIIDGRPRRKDFESLLESEHYAIHLDATSATRMFKALRRQEKMERELRQAFYAWVARLSSSGELELIYTKNEWVRLGRPS